MNDEMIPFQIDDVDFSFSLVRRKRETLEISVYPDGSLQLVAPEEASIEDLLQKVKKRSIWIKRKRQHFRSLKQNDSAQFYLSGANVTYLGKSYVLKVQPGLVERVRVERGRLLVDSHKPHSATHTALLLDRWRRSSAREVFEEAVAAFVPQFRRHGDVTPKRLAVRSMTKRWGSMTNSGTLTLNIALLEKPIQSIEYVVAHELAHRLVPDHSPRFWRLLSEVMPQWKERKEELELFGRF